MNETINQEKRALETVQVIDMVSTLTNAQSTLREEDYEHLEEGIAKGRAMRKRQSVKSRVAKFMNQHQDISFADMKEALAELEAKS